MDNGAELYESEPSAAPARLLARRQRPRTAASRATRRTTRGSRLESRFVSEGGLTRRKAPAPRQARGDERNPSRPARTEISLGCVVRDGRSIASQPLVQIRRRMPVEAAPARPLRRRHRRRDEPGTRPPLPTVPTVPTVPTRRNRVWARCGHGLHPQGPKGINVLVRRVGPRGLEPRTRGLAGVLDRWCPQLAATPP